VPAVAPELAQDSPGRTLRRHQDPGLDLLQALLALDGGRDPGRGLAEADQLRVLLGARRPGQRAQRNRLQEVGLALGVASEENGGGALEGKLELGVIAEIEERDVG